VTDALVLPGVTYAYANHGRWVADCSHVAYCDAAAHLDRFQDGFICECGRGTTVVWPSGDVVAGVERLLGMRPNPKNRNWMPGETLTDLMWENGAHGVFDNVEAVPGTSMLSVEEGRIVTDLLPALLPTTPQGGWSRSLGMRQ
jgi:hypothetical protein